MTGADALGSESRFKDSPDRGNERSSACKKDAVDIARIDARPPQESVDAAFDGM